MASQQSAATTSAHDANIRQRLECAAAEFSTDVVELLGGDVRMTVGQIDRTTYDAFVQDTADRANYCSLLTTPDVGRLLLQLPRQVLGLVLDRMLGAVRQAGTLATLPLTDIEARLVSKVINQLNTSVQNAWHDTMSFQIVMDQSTTDLRPLRLLPADAEMLVATFQLELGGAVAEIQLLLPANWQQRIAEVHKAITGKTGGSAKKTGDEGEATVELVARLAETEIRAEDLAELNVGDILTTEKDVGEPLDLTIGDEVKYRANLGKVGDKKAVRIVEEVKVEEAQRKE